MKTAKTIKTTKTTSTVSIERDLNHMLTNTGKKPVFQAHYTGKKDGLMGLLIEIFESAGAVFPDGIESTDLRQIAVSKALFLSEIIAQVEKKFTAGSSRYPMQSIKNYLSFFGKNIFKVIKLTNEEDKNRPGKKPRGKWYMIEGAKE